MKNKFLIIILISSPAQAELSIEKIFKSTSKQIPEIEAMQAQIEKARFEYIEALGSFDTKIKAGSNSEILGGYPAMSNKLLIDQTTESGIQLFGGYRIGRGSFATYDGKKKTNQYGEIQGGLLIPLQRNLGMNNPRFKLQKQSIGKLLSVAMTRIQKIKIQGIANMAYWNWFIAGQTYVLYNELLTLAVERQNQIERRVQLGDLPSLYLNDNKRTIFARREQVLSALRLFKTASIYLSYFHRNSKKEMIITDEKSLPKNLTFKSQEFKLKSEVDKTIQFSPKLVVLKLKKKEKVVLKELAQNMRKPQIDLFIMGSKDIGGDDPKKDPFQLDLGVNFSLPIQNRKAKGLEGVANSEIKIIEQENIAVKDNLKNKVNSLLVKMSLAKQRYKVLENELNMAKLVADSEKRAFFLGNSSLIFVNKRETDVTKSSLRLQKAKVNYLKTYYELRILQGLE